MSFLFKVCDKSLTTSSKRLRHERIYHLSDAHNLSQSSIAVNATTVLQHPFTCIVAGCTQSAKTVWVKTLLENAQKTISPTPQRVIWCYGQWQPSYFDMKRTMPGIEFNEGIPDDIHEPDYLDISQRNLIVRFWMILWHNPAKTNVSLISLQEEVITGICRSSTCTLCKIFFIKARKCEILA